MVQLNDLPDLLQFRLMLRIGGILNILRPGTIVKLEDHWKLSLHDSILDLCRSKAKEEEFLKIVDKCNISEKAYRLVVHMDGGDNDLDVPKAVENITPLRSVQIIPKVYNISISRPKKFFNLPQFKSLRILIVYSRRLGGKCFHGIENLIHLRLLGLMACNWERFSLESVDKLSFLQTLNLSRTEILLTTLLPVDTFCKMRQLRHLYLPKFSHEVGIKGKLRLRNLSQLDTLYNFESEFYDLKDLIHLQKLRTLRGCVVSDDESLVQITDYICRSNLRWIDIRIENCNLDESDDLRKLLKIPSVTLRLHIYSHKKLLKLPRLETVDFSKMCPGLVHLVLDSAVITEDIMPALAKFPNLKNLWLLYIRFGGEEMICDAGSFPRLKELHFHSVNGKFKLRIDEAAMPNLSSMEIELYSGINFMIPERLRLLAHLEECSESVFN